MTSLRSRIALAYSALIFVAMVAVATTTFTRSRLEGLAPILALVVVLAIAGSIVLAFAIAEAVTRPLERLRVASRALASGAYTGAVNGGGGSEVAELASAFNEMTARLQETMLSLEQERSRLEALLDASTDAIVVLDAAGSVRYLNPAAESLYGRIEGRSLAEVARDAALTHVLRSALPSRSEYIPRGRDAEGRALIAIDDRGLWLQATASAITGGGGWAVLVVLHDVTEARRAETTRRDFVANVSHELRTPLAGIKAVVETLRDGALDDRNVAEEFLGHVDGEVDRLVQLVEELLQLARIESGTAIEMTEVVPSAVLTACVARFRPQAERAGVNLALDMEPLPLVSANAAQLGQALGNLVHNAIKFTPPGGGVTVSAVQDGSELRIKVTDTGCGIDPADLSRIFERFYVVDRARSARGTGLGLAIVKHVVRVHGGSVEAQSRLGVGSTFTISLPVATPVPVVLPSPSVVLPSPSVDGEGPGVRPRPSF